MSVTDEHLQAIAKIVGLFLLEHGGFANGHCTSARGDVSIDTHSSLKLYFPYAAKKDMTVARLEELGEECYLQVRHYMVKNRFNKQLKIKIRERMVDEYGTMETIVMFTQVHVVPLWQLGDKT